MCQSWFKWIIATILIGVAYGSCGDAQEKGVSLAPSSQGPTEVGEKDKEAGTINLPSASQDASSVSDAAIDGDYEKCLNEMRESIKEARQSMMAYHLSSKGPQENETLKKFANAIDISRQKHAALVSAAIKKYSARPGQDSQIEHFLYDVLSKSCEDDFFEGMLDIGLALEKGGCKEAKLQYHIAFAAAGNGKYDLAQKHLEKFAASGFDFSKLSEEVRTKFIEEARILEGCISSGPSLNELWEAEKKAVTKDLAGEPLPRVRIITNKGTLIVELFEDQAPDTVGNFVKLVEEGFYNGLTFHRVINHFMAQGGCPLGDGSGDPGYTIVGELNRSEARNFFRGTLGMALANGPDTGGSQFFVCYLPQLHLNGKYVAFGRVVSGLSVLADLVRLDKSDTEKKDSAGGPPPDQILLAEVISKRNHPYVGKIAAKSAQ